MNVETQNKPTPWAQTVRRESGLIEHICEHGVGHPAYGSIVYQESLTEQTGLGVHGCCGCCRSPSWQLADAREGCRIANKILGESHRAKRG